MRNKLGFLAATPVVILLIAGCARRPPTVNCVVSPQQIIQDEKATVHADVVVGKRARVISYGWTSDGGKVTGTGDTATFDATGVAPGKYTVKVSVADNHKQGASCESEIVVNKKYLPPTVSCSVRPDSIMEGESATISAAGNSPDGSPLTYAWSVNGQRQTASSEVFVFGSQGRQPGTYTIAATVDTGKFTASCSSTVTVRELPVPAPVIACLTPVTDVETGGSAALRVRASAERATPTVSWSATGGTVSGNNQEAVLNTTGLSAGTYTVTATVDNGRGGRSSCTMTVNVSQRINVPGFPASRDRLDNVAKAILDNIAVQMKNDPRLRATVSGYTDGSGSESRVKGLALKRAEAVIQYLTSAGIDATRLTAADGGARTLADSKTEAGRKQNRRVEIELGVR